MIRGHCQGCGQRVTIDVPPDGHVVPEHASGCSPEYGCAAGCPEPNLCGPVEPDRDGPGDEIPHEREGGRSAEVVGESPWEVPAKESGGTTLPRASDELRRREGESDLHLDAGPVSDREARRRREAAKEQLWKAIDKYVEALILYGDPSEEPGPLIAIDSDGNPAVFPPRPDADHPPTHPNCSSTARARPEATVHCHPDHEPEDAA